MSSQLNQNELFIDKPNHTTYVFIDGKMVPIGTIGAPFGTQIDGVNAEDISLGHIDFINDNQNEKPIVHPGWDMAFLASPESTVQGDGSCNTIVKWSWNCRTVPLVPPDARSIDGFLIQVSEQQTNATVVWADYAQHDSNFNAVAVAFDSNRVEFSYVHNSAMNLYLQFRVIPYRTVGGITGKPFYTLYGVPRTTNMFQPWDKLEFDNVSVKNLNNSFQNITTDTLIEPVEKLSVIRRYADSISTVAGANSAYQIALAKIAQHLDFPAETATALNAARDALNFTLNTKYPIAKIDSPTTSTGNLSWLIEGTTEVDANNQIVNSTVANWKKTHIITDRTAFRAKFEDYDAALGAVDIAITLLSVAVDNSSTRAYIDELADSVLTAPEKVKFKGDILQFGNDKDSLKVDLYLADVLDFSTKATALETNYAMLYAEFFTHLRLSYNATTGVYLSTPDKAFSTDMLSKSKFETTAAVLAFYSALDSWKTNYDSTSLVVATTKSTFLTSVALWSASTDAATEYKSLFTGPILSPELLAAFQKLRSDVKASWTAMKKVLDVAGYSDTVTTALATLDTEASKARLLVNTNDLSSSQGSLSAFITTKNRFIRLTVAEAETLFNAMVGLRLAWNTSLENYSEQMYVTSDGLLSIMEDGFINPTEKTKGAKSLVNILAEMKAKYPTIIADALTHKVSSSAYASAYGSLVAALETTNYQIKGSVKWGVLLGISKTEYTAETGGSSSTGTKTANAKTHLVDGAAFTLLITNFNSEVANLKEAIAASTRKVVDAHQESHSTDLTAIAAPTSLSITFGTDTDGDGDIDATVSWDWVGDTATIDGFIEYTAVRINSLIVTRSAHSLFDTKDKNLHAVTEKSHEYELKAKRFVNLYVVAYRIVDKATYTAFTGSKFQDTKTKTYYLVSPVARFANSGTLPQVTARYVPVNYVSVSVPVGIKNLDFWLNSSKTATTSGVLPQTWGQWNGTSYRQLSDSEASLRLPVLAKSVSTIASDTEPLNNSGFYWKNTKSKGVSGVLPGAVVFWNSADGYWDTGASNTLRFSGTVEPTLAAVSAKTVPYAQEGALYVYTTGTSKWLYRAKNGSWRIFKIYGTGRWGADTPVIGLTTKYYLDTDDFRAYERASTSLAWEEVDLFPPVLVVKLSTSTDIVTQ